MTIIKKLCERGDFGLFLYAPEKKDDDTLLRESILILAPKSFPHDSILTIYNQRERALNSDRYISLGVFDVVHGYISKERDETSYRIWHRGSPTIGEDGLPAYKGHKVDDHILRELLEVLINQFGDGLVRIWTRKAGSLIDEADRYIKLGRASQIVKRISQDKFCLEERLKEN